MDENEYKKSIHQYIGEEKLFTERIKRRILNDIKSRKQRRGLIIHISKLSPILVLLLLIGGGILFYVTTKATTENDELINAQLADYESQLVELKKENELLNNDILTINADYSVKLQIADGNSRRIMRYISEGKFEQLKTEYNAKFEVTDGKLKFSTLDEFHSGFPIEQASFPMSIAYFNPQSEFTEIGYYLDDLKTDTRYSITFSYDKDGNFEYIFVGDV